MTEFEVRMVAFGIAGLGLAYAMWIMIRTRLRLTKSETKPVLAESRAIETPAAVVSPAEVIRAPHASVEPVLSAVGPTSPYSPS